PAGALPAPGGLTFPGAPGAPVTERKAMRIHMTARHCEWDPEDRLLAEQRLEKLSRYARILEAHVIVTQEKYRYTAEITLRLPGPDLTSREEADRARTAIERAADRIEHQVRRLKERRIERRRADRRGLDVMPPAAPGGDEGWEAQGEAAGEE